MKYNQSNYRRVYEDKPEEISALVASEEEPSLSEVVQVFSGKFSDKNVFIKIPRGGLRERLDWSRILTSPPNTRRPWATS